MKNKRYIYKYPHKKWVLYKKNYQIKYYIKRFVRDLLDYLFNKILKLLKQKKCIVLGYDKFDLKLKKLLYNKIIIVEIIIR